MNAERPSAGTRPDPRSETIADSRVATFAAAEVAQYRARHPECARLTAGGIAGYYDGVPMHWLRDWPLPFLPVVREAQGATLVDVDGHEYADFCLGDTGAMFGHSPPPVVEAIRAQAGRGLTHMLPTADAIAVGALLRERFRLPCWQVAATATDANRYALRVARAVTGRPRILVFNGCYHGTVDETMVRLDAHGRAMNRPGLLGQASDLTAGTRVVEFNDPAALEAALEHGDVACVITEPALTNCAMVLPEPGFHARLRELTRLHGTLLLIDETHTIASGPRGYTGRHGLEPDLFVLGKPVAGGVPASVWGFTEAVASRLDAVRAATVPGHSGMGTTLSANALALAAMRACLEQVMSDEAYAHMDALAATLLEGLQATIRRRGLPWHALRLGARVEFVCAPGPLRNGGEAEAAHRPALERALHLALLNRGCLIAPFHNMMLTCPATSFEQVERLVGAFEQATERLLAA